VSGSVHATRKFPAATLRQALLGKVVTVRDALSPLPRELGPDIPYSAASQALSVVVRSGSAAGRSSN
jgi:transitional endoplasmic reticulum ATPase